MLIVDAARAVLIADCALASLYHKRPKGSGRSLDQTRAGRGEVGLRKRGDPFLRPIATPFANNYKGGGFGVLGTLTNLFNCIT
jgi:hypothetical protein